MTGEIVPAGDSPAVGRELRASHEDRDKVAEQLRVAAGDGRISADELDQRLGVALTARTYGELAALTADLPGVAEAAPAAPAARPRRAVARIDVGSATLKRAGQWDVPQQLEVRVGSGTVVLDFTQVTVAYPSVEVDAEVRSGNLRFITRPGVEVDAADVTIRSGGVKIRAPWGARVPATLLIRVTGQVSSGNITARPQRRTFAEWLRRVPYHRAGQ